jgi:hypothetical protein
VISQKVFAVYLNYNNNFESSITFGGYDKTKILPGYNLTMLKAKNSKDWKISINAY